MSTDPIDPGLLRKNAHSPSFFALQRASSGRQDLVDFCIPCNPYFPTPGMFSQLSGSLEHILKYYPSDADTITAELCATLGHNPQTVVMGNGSTELITWIDHLLVRESLATPIPTFGRWTDQPMETGKRVDMFQLHELRGFEFDVDAFVQFVRARGSRVAVVCNPNNPDGGYVPRREIVRLLDCLIDLDLVVVDESFLDFVDAEAHTSVADEARIRPNVIVLKSLGKNFGLHGIRFGYMVANPALAQTVRRGAAEVESQLLRRGRGVPAARARRRVPGEPAAARPRPDADGPAARVPARAEGVPVAGQLHHGQAAGRQGRRGAARPSDRPPRGVRPRVRQQAGLHEPVPAARRPAAGGRAAAPDRSRLLPVRVLGGGAARQRGLARPRLGEPAPPVAVPGLDGDPLSRFTDPQHNETRPEDFRAAI
ncbi:aminotransferase class I/II-fold pyridoxal phosphate-dependent enzyme [Actinomadura madurae]|nr:aminotransferase class I/II-fold pyridoxal phosphate-dependent enzyme [Actinomadura madurae]MCQ0010709.1 aminotransferase class I/II-fold pyridoxal phosphate-dependent enzyme [Actinomadura madurae]